jgi:hypothetical protein
MRRARDPNARIRYNLSAPQASIRAQHEAMPPIGAQIHFMVSVGNVESLCQFTWSGTKTFHIVDPSPFLHSLDPGSRFQSTDQDEAVCLSFHEHIQHPVHPVVEIDIGCTGFVSVNKAARAWPRKSVGGFVINCRVRFNLNNNPGTIAPNQFRADELARTRERIALKKRATNKLLLHDEPGNLHKRETRRTITALKTCHFIKDR